jgi:hypothetical protein
MTYGVFFCLFFFHMNRRVTKLLNWQYITSDQKFYNCRISVTESDIDKVTEKSLETRSNMLTLGVKCLPLHSV